MENVKIFIKGNVPSAKNSKVWTGKRLVMSKTVQRYIRRFGYQWKHVAFLFKEAIKDKKPPYKVYFTFYRGTRHKFDYVNAAQLPLDLMVRNGWIEDDNADIVVPVFLSYKYDRENPGVLIELKNE